MTALHYASWQGHNDTIKYLIKEKAEVNAVDIVCEIISNHV